MSCETELKLSLPSHQVEALRRHPFWQEFASSPNTYHLGNTYYDTSDRQLNQLKVALRIREKNGQYVQTLKTKGESINGLTRRGEWEWSIAVPMLDRDGLQAVWPDHLPEVNTAALTPLFSTDFDRTCWEIQWLKPNALIEAALDIGWVKAGRHQSPICELELELLQGDERALGVVARALSQFVELIPSDKSKAERGVELMAGHFG